MREQVISNRDKQRRLHIIPFNPNDIAWGIKQVLESKDKRIQIGKNTRDRVIAHFSWDIMIDRTLHIYEEFVN